MTPTNETFHSNFSRLPTCTAENNVDFHKQALVKLSRLYRRGYFQSGAQ
jgi:hypothetical protein